VVDKIEKDLQCSGVPCSLWRAYAPTQRDRPLCVPVTGIVLLFQRAAPFGLTHVGTLPGPSCGCARNGKREGRPGGRHGKSGGGARPQLGRIS